MIFYVLVSLCVFHKTVCVTEYLTACSNRTSFSVTMVGKTHKLATIIKYMPPNIFSSL